MSISWAVLGSVGVYAYADKKTGALPALTHLVHSAFHVDPGKKVRKFSFLSIALKALFCAALRSMAGVSFRVMSGLQNASHPIFKN